MAAESTPISLTDATLQGFVQFEQACYAQFNMGWSVRPMLEFVDKQYMREGNLGYDNVQSILANAQGDFRKIQDPVVPIVYPQVETGLAYLVSSFLTGFPMFSAAGTPQNIDVALQVDTIFQQQQVKGKWVREFMMAFRDGLKYNYMGIDTSWVRETTYSLVTDASFKNGNEGKPEQIVWQGNRCKRIDPYNCIFDMRVPIADVAQKGEFGGYTEIYTRVMLKTLINSLPQEGLVKKNIEPSFSSNIGGGMMAQQYYIPQINPNALGNSPVNNVNLNWLAWSGLENPNKVMPMYGIYEVTTLYVRIIPSDFNIRTPFASHPQIWKLILINHQYVIYFERLTNAHNMLPTVFGQPIEDGLWFQTKSFAWNVIPYQQIATANMACKAQGDRRRVMDRIFYDPSRIREADINKDNPVARIPVKNSAYNKGVGEAFAVVPFQEQNMAGWVQGAELVLDMAQRVNGINKPQEGQFQKGNKTRREFETVMGNSNARLQTLALFIEAQMMTTIKEILKTNVLQFQGAGSIFNLTEGRGVAIDPVALRKASLELQISDGMLPTDKILDSSFMQVVLQAIASDPGLRAEYDSIDMFIWWAKSQGAKFIDDFKRTPEEKQQYIAQTQAMTNAQQPNVPQPQAPGAPA